MNICAVCGGSGPMDLSAHIDHTEDCRIGQRRAFLVERDDPISVAGVAASAMARTGGKQPKKPAQRRNWRGRM